MAFLMLLTSVSCSSTRTGRGNDCPDEEVISKALEEMGYFNLHYKHDDSLGVVVTKRRLKSEMSHSPNYLKVHFGLKNEYYSVCDLKEADSEAIHIASTSKLNTDFTVMTFEKLDSLDGFKDKNVTFSFIEVTQVYRNDEGKFYFELIESGHTHTSTSYFGTLDSCRIKVDSTLLNFMN